MTGASVPPRTANLVAAFALAAAERVSQSAERATRRAASDTAALVLLTTALGGASQDALAAALGLTQSGAVRLVDRLVADGLAERRPGPDARTHAVVPTSRGIAAGREALVQREQASSEILRPLDPADHDELARLLEKLLGGLITARADAFHVCRLCDPDACGHDTGHCPVTNAAAAIPTATDTPS
jgi:DNA-binding MarR family transcriptional regulator